MSKLTAKLSPRVKAELQTKEQTQQTTISNVPRYQRKKVVEPEPETVPDPWESEPQEESELVSLVKQTSQAPVDDVIVNQIHAELEDIGTKLQTIAYLKAMEKPLKQRAKALMSTLGGLQKAMQDMVAVGATELPPLSEQDKTVIAQIISQTMPLDTSILENYKVPPEVLHGDDFR